MPILRRVSRESVPATTSTAASVYRRLRLLPARAESFVNDVHSQLNRTRVRSIVCPDSIEALQEIVKKARARGWAISIAGGRHAMGGQQFGTNNVLLDMSRLNRVFKFDAERREVEVEAGIQWPELVGYLINEQRGRAGQLGIIQKQTGADRLSIGGALAANMHGGGLSLKPVINDVESFVLIDAEGNALTCSGSENAELFRLAIGGHRLFGIHP